MFMFKQNGSKFFLSINDSNIAGSSLVQFVFHFKRHLLLAMEQSPMAYVRPTLLLSVFVVMFSAAQPIYHTQNECYSKDFENVYQVLREFRSDIDELKHSIKQLQNREQGLEMRPMILFARFDDTIELTCSIHNRGYEWSAVNIFQQNTSGSFFFFNVSKDGKVESKNGKINGSMTVGDNIINVTVSFAVRRDPGVCELNQTYSCNIQLVDTSISSKAANTTVVLETPPLNLTVETMPYEYIGIIDETINCTATVNPNTTVLFLIGKMSMKNYVFAERKNVQTFVDSENQIGCYRTVRTVFNNLFLYLHSYPWVGCLANDTVSGQTSISEFKRVNVVIINR
ncbi:uncharacterized protein [Magallana gigas]|uniref:uncharacterized protein n=1 Tax=Magallana gigas TaxID=29159 RepID=UPI0033417111